MKIKQTTIYVLIVLLILLLGGCKMFTDIVSPNKIAGRWYGGERGSGTFTARLNIGGSGDFKADFKDGKTKYTIKGTCTHTPQQSWWFSKNEVGAISFRWDNEVVACEYAVTASSLMLWHWKDKSGELRNLVLFR